MKVRTQHFRSICSHPEELEVGAFIFENDDSEYMHGFVYKGNAVTGVMEVVLFEPEEVELKEGMESISETVESWSDMLGETRERMSPEMLEQWVMALKQP